MTEEAWFARRTEGAPPALAGRATEWLALAQDGVLADRLADAGQRALGAAVECGAHRGAALDLLAADALITLSLLACAEQAPERLATHAVQLRMLATVIHE